MQIGTLIRRAAQYHGDAACLVEGERSISFREFDAATDRLGNALLARGLVPSDRVGVLLPRGLEECAALFAASRADAVVVPLNPVLRAAQVRHVLADCEARVLVTQRALLGSVAEAIDGLPGLRLLCLDDEPGPDGPAPAELPPACGIGQDLAAILYTSGSTGSPKGVMLSHANLLAGTRIVRSYLGIHADDRILAVLPFSFDYGLNQLLTVVEQGAQIVLATFQLGDQIVRLLALHRITGLAGVPTVWAMLTRAAPSLPKTRLPDLRYITNSGGAVPEATVRRLRELLPSTQVQTQPVALAGTASSNSSLPMKPDSGGNPASETATSRNSRLAMRPIRGVAMSWPAPPRPR